MRVLVATSHGYLPERVGGAESSAHDLALTLHELGVEVAVLAARMSPGAPLARDEVMGYPVFRASSPRDAAGQVARQLRPDAAIVQCGRPLALAAALRSEGVPSLVYLRDDLLDDLGGPVPSGVRFAAVSRFIARLAKERMGVEAAPIPPVIRPERYRVESARRNVTFVCPMPVKGADIAFALAERRRDIPFNFVESWPLRPARRFLVRARASISRNVRLSRPVSDARAFYRDAKVLLAPSRWGEGWARVVSEAQLSGIPVLASARGGLPESVGPGGITIDPDAGIDRWERALSILWDDPREYARLGALALEHASRQEMAPLSIARRVLAELEQVAAARVT